MSKFCKATSFSKTMISILAALKIQKEELEQLNEMFNTLDINKDGVLSLDELKNGLGQFCTFELF